MRKINLDDPKITLRLDLELKKKAARIATARGLSVSQLIEELISQTDGEASLGAEQIRAIVREEMRKSRAEKPSN
jgi:antitoxin component of RelBE/YafQ-DinJ toxin-antitoxin module